jgi:DNA/RNA endonuclease YhcR with UshA esterase domain
MRRAALIAALITLSTVATTAVAGVQNALTVPVDQSRRVPFNGQAASVISGNGDLIHAYIVSPTDVRVVGRKLGMTNLVVLDAVGNTLFEREINVSAGEGSVVTIYRGSQTTNYACSPYCTTTQGNPGLAQPYSGPVSVVDNQPDPLAATAPSRASQP